MKDVNLLTSNGVNVEEHIYIKDFAYDYVRTINGTNDLVSADRRLKAITGKDEKGICVFGKRV